ncbi:ribonuclease P protein subunit p40-like [Athalia rosae]|uniref:ribonuclease P protein subunit p40-like n=1 Tax=Athalia rosae TaxID=37344 RepID=UPI0020346C8E|nr:ribonuclease P protein subunit p40-like [Athalia rosae]XP_048508744.1 ribonuclease P protein subunit p40-like [Athalia rosae]
MLCPEVWDFKAPQHNFKVVKSDSLTKEVTSAIKNHYFNHSVQVVLPDTVNLPHHIFENFNADSDYYRVNGLQAQELVDKEFVEAFVKKGEVNILAIESRVDTANSLAVTPSGHLILSLVKEDFQSLGLEGSPSFFDRKVKTRFVVTIDLKEEIFTPGKKNYEHVRRCLTNNLHQSFDIILAWNPPDDKLCPSSVAAWFHKRGYEVKLCRQVKVERSEYSLKIPIINSSTDDGKLFEWLGMFSIGGDLEDTKYDSYVNRYQCPAPMTEVGQIRSIRWMGFMTRIQVENIFHELRCYIQQRETIPWASIDVQGFMDTPISWKLQEHNYLSDGDNSFTIFMKPNGSYVLRTSLSSNNKPRIFQ